MRPLGVDASPGRSRLAGPSCWIGVAGLAASAILALACADAGPPRPNVIVLLVDTLRAQNLGAYGYRRPTSPHLDALAEKSFLFEEARAQAPCTFPSVNSILTGLPPSRFAGQPDHRLGIPDGVVTLPAILHDQGYATAAVSASPIVRATPSRFNPHGGFGPGFDHFDESCEWRTAACVNRQALDQIDGLAEPFFLYLHFMEPHGPYRPGKDWPRQFAVEPYSGSEDARQGNPNPIAQRIADGELFAPGSPERADMAHMSDLYDDEIAFFDASLGRLVDDLAERGLLERTVLILLADHGEEFYEHGHVKHCHTVYDTEVKTPLLMRFPPDVEPSTPRRVASPAANLDVVPTLLDYLGIQPPPNLVGASLRPAIEGRKPVRQAVVSEWSGYRAASDGRFKLILRVARGKPQLYDLTGDPGETRNVVADHPREVRRLAREIERWARQEKAMAKERGKKRQWDDDVVDRLRSLGYIQ